MRKQRLYIHGKTARVRGAALIMVMMLLLLLGGVAVMAIQSASWDERITANASASAKVRAAAMTCRDIVMEMMRDEVDTRGFVETYYMIPAPVGDINKYNQKLTGATVVKHPIIGECIVTDNNCLPFAPSYPDIVDGVVGSPDGIPESYCCCRTGYLFTQPDPADDKVKILNYDRTRPAHIDIPEGNLAMYFTSIITGSKLAKLKRMGSVVGHLVITGASPATENNTTTTVNANVSITAAMGLIVKEYVLAVQHAAQKQKAEYNQ
jgi:hypothetical protein